MLIEHELKIVLCVDSLLNKTKSVNLVFILFSNVEAGVQGGLLKLSELNSVHSLDAVEHSR